MIKHEVKLLICVVGLLSDAAVRCGDVLSIHCHIGLTLHVTRCQLLQSNDSDEHCHHHHHHHHHHLETCPESQSKPYTYHTAEQTDNSQHHHHHCDRSCPDVQAQRTFTSHSDTKDDWFYVERAVVGQLNDVFWVDNCLTALQQLIDHQQQQQHSHLPYQLIVSSQTPTMFPIAALRLGLVSDICFLDLDPAHRPLIGRLLSANGVGVSEGHVAYSCPRQRDVTSVLFVDIVSSEGCLRQNVFELLTEARSVSVSLVFGCCFFFWF